MIVVYHAPGDDEEARSILTDGFVDWDGTYGTADHWVGVWVSSRPPKVRAGEPIVFVEIPNEEEIRPYEWVPEELGYREWLVPAEVLNRFVCFRPILGRPVGAITWSPSVAIAAPELMRAIRTGLDSEWARLPIVLREAQEWAWWAGFDEAGERWIRLGDARVIRAAFAGAQGLLDDGDQVSARLNWWVEGIPDAAFPLTVPGASLPMLL